LLILVGVERPPNLDDLALLIVPQVVETELMGQPIKLLTSLTNESEESIFVILGDVHLGVMAVGWRVGSHLYLLVVSPFV
jgi:hypothetical protein